LEVGMEKILRFIDRASIWTGKVSSLLVAVLTAAICYDITMRYVLIKPTSWAFELTYMIYGVYAMLGAAYCHYLKGHVRMDLLYMRLSPRKQAVVEVFCYIFLFFPLFIVLVWKCGEHAHYAIAYGERSSSSAWRPVLWPFKTIIAFGFLLFLLQGTADFLRSLRIAIKGESHES
jgi:TRAP-type mannitol/chloroaromatic compound transport system permease small subunit